jgi:hypothetical protein
LNEKGRERKKWGMEERKRGRDIKKGRKQEGGIDKWIFVEKERDIQNTHTHTRERKRETA